jgi:hypothetical protein
MKLSRRKALLTAAAALAPVPVSAQQAPATLPANSDAELDAARNRTRAMARQVYSVPLPMHIEPAVRFRP